MDRRRLGIAAAFALIAAATLVPAPGAAWERDFFCLKCGGSFDPVELLLNVLLFVPLGLALRAAGVRATVAIVTVVATTASIEALQFTVIVGRDGTIRDCLTNTMGGVLGFALQPHASALWRANGRPSRRLAWAGAFLWVAHAAMASILFHPSVTPQRYFSQIAPHLGQYDAFEGSVSSASIDGVPVNSGPFPPALQSAVKAADSIVLAAVVGPASPVAHVAPIVNIADAERSEIAILAQARTAAVFQARVRAQDVGLYAPAVVLDEVFSTTAALPKHLAGTRRGYLLRLRETSANDAPREATLLLSPSLGWALWWPDDFPGSSALVWMTVLWLLLPIGLIGFWSGRRDGSQVHSLGPPFVALIGAHVLAPLVLGPGAVSWSHPAIAAAGAAVGVALGQLRSARTRESLGT